MIAQTDMFASRMRVEDAIERSDARVQRDTTETEIIRLLTEIARQHDTWDCDLLGAKLDEMRVPRDGAVRRRLLSTTVNRLRRKPAQIVSQGYVIGKAGRPISTWTWV